MNDANPDVPSGILDIVESAVAIYDLRNNSLTCSKYWSTIFSERLQKKLHSGVAFAQFMDVMSSVAAGERDRLLIERIRVAREGDCEVTGRNLVRLVAEQNFEGNLASSGSIVDQNGNQRVIVTLSNIQGGVVPLAMAGDESCITFSETAATFPHQLASSLPLMASKSLELFRQFLKRCECPAYLRQNDRLIDANEAAAHLCGYSSVEELLQIRRVSNLYAEEYREDVRTVAESGGIILDTLQQIGKNGDKIHAMAVGSSFIEDGVEYRIVLFQDSKIDVKDKLALKQSEQRFKDIASCSGDWFWETDKEHIFTHISFNNNETQEFEMDSIVGNSFISWLNRKSEQGLITDYQEDIHRLCANLEKRLYIRDFEVSAFDLHRGKKITLSLSAKPIFSASGSFAGYRGITKNISYQKNLENALIVSKQAAENRSLEKSALLASISHEVRTPLTNILGYVELIRIDAKRGRTKLDDTQIEQIETIWRSGDQLRTLINNVLSLERLESGIDKAERVIVNLSTLFVELQQAYSLAMSINNTVLTIECDESTPEQIYTDPVKLRQILHNIIGNATKFTYSGEVQVCTTVKNNFFVLRVVDTGIGMSAEQLDLLPTTTRPIDLPNTLSRGSGLGVALCQHYVSQMEGYMEIESTLGQGTSVEIRLPILPLPKPKNVSVSVEKEQLPANALSHSTKPVDTFTDPKPQVLIVDDNEAHKQLLVGIVDRLELQTIEAADGEEAIRKWQRHKPDIVFMDLRMPGIDGSAAAFQIRLKETEMRLTPCRIVAVSADGASHKEVNLVDNGFDEFLSKPYRSVDVHRLMHDFGIIKSV